MLNSQNLLICRQSGAARLTVNSGIGSNDRMKQVLRSETMSQPTLSQIEESFSQLPVSEQRRLIERLARRVNEQSQNRDEDMEDQLAQMATDLDIQREMREIA